MTTLPHIIGYDIGSRTGKAVVTDRDGNILHSALTETLGNSVLTYERLRGAIPFRFLRDDTLSAATGYGRAALEGRVRRTATEITCHFLGARRRVPDAVAVIDIGGQDAKVIAIEGDRIRDFAMNDKCAAGAGRFLEVMTARLGYPMERFAALDVSGVEPPLLSSTCTVFAESELISLMASGAEPLALASAIAAMAARMTAHLAARVHAAPPYFMTGGVSRIAPVRYHLARILGAPVATTDDAQFTGAHGAALLLLNERKEGRSKT